jgi:DNA processing protein
MAPNHALAEAPAENFLPFPTLAAEPLVEVLRLIRTPNVGPITFFQLLRRFGNCADALHHLPDLARRGGSKAPLAPISHAQAEKEIADALRFGARIIRYGEADYPALLHNIPDPPPVLMALGNPALWREKRSIGMVGARNASANGCAFAKKLAAELGASTLTVISGLARGIDTFAHQGALATGTVAVIGGGIDNIYPPENKALYAELAERGAILSEQPFGSAPFAASFPGRNRIISGMCPGVVVVEASLKSGSLITARFALEQGREVFAVPGSPMDPRAQGTNALIKQGAHLVENAQDVLNELRGTLAERSWPQFHVEHREPDEAELAAAHRLVLEKLGTTPVLVDELLKQCQLTGGLLFTVLMELELAGRISRVAGNKICLRYSD